MKTGMTVEQLGRPLVWRTRIDSIRAGKNLATGLPLLDGRLSVDGKGQVPERLDATFPSDLLPVDPLDPLAAYGQRLRVTITLEQAGETFEYPLGVYVIDSWQEQANGSIKVSGSGLLRVVADAPWAYPTSPKPGSHLLDEATRLVSPLPVSLESGVSNPVLGRGIAWGNDRLDALYDLASAYDLSIVTRADGKIWLVPSLQKKRLDRVYSGRDLALSMLRSGDHTRANEVSVVHTEHKKDREINSVRTARFHTPPFEPAGYGIVRRVEESEVSLYGVMQSQADRSLNQELLRTRERKLEVVADPGLELWDTIGIQMESEFVAGRVQAFDLPLVEGGRMRVDVVEERQ